MPVHLSIAERFLLRVGVIPAPLVDFTGQVAFRLLLAGHRLGVFDALAARSLDVSDLAAQIHADPVALEALLDVLHRLGYVSVHGGRYANTRAADRWLSAASGQTLAPLVPFLGDLLARLDHVEETLRRGQPARTAYEFYDQHPERWPSFHAGQRAIATFTIDEVARKARLAAGPLRLLDVGGSHALYSIALCRRFPRLRAEIFDWPAGVEAAREEIQQAGFHDRITTRTGDFLTDDLGQGYDVVLLGNIVHGQKPEVIARLLRRVHDALRDGGTLLIVDQVRMPWFFTVFAGLTAAMTGVILLNELGGAVYPYESLRAWLNRCGFRDVRLRRLLRAPGNVLIQASAGPPR